MLVRLAFFHTHSTREICACVCVCVFNVVVVVVVICWRIKKGTGCCCRVRLLLFVVSYRAVCKCPFQLSIYHGWIDFFCRCEQQETTTTGGNKIRRLFVVDALLFGVPWKPLPNKNRRLRLRGNDLFVGVAATGG